MKKSRFTSTVTQRDPVETNWDMKGQDVCISIHRSLAPCVKRHILHLSQTDQKKQRRQGINWYWYINQTSSFCNGDKVIHCGGTSLTDTYFYCFHFFLIQERCSIYDLFEFELKRSQVVSSLQSCLVTFDVSVRLCLLRVVERTRHSLVTSVKNYLWEFNTKIVQSPLYTPV